LFDGSTFVACISDADCDIKNDYHIFNHFDNSGAELKLVPECRSISAQAMAGFTCGTDPSLEHGTRVVLPNVPTTDYYNDDRKVTILKKEHYTECLKALAGQEECLDHSSNTVCPNILFFQSGCASTRIENGLVVFENAFYQQECLPRITVEIH